MADLSRRLGLLLALVLLAFGLTVVGAQAAPSERILDFQSRVVVHPDSTMTVTETIIVQSLGYEIKRGIIREFPTTYRDNYGNTVKVGFTLKEVLRKGRPEPFRLEPFKNGVKIRIGHRDVFLSQGEHTYTITYVTDRQLGYFKDHDELYWNVTGTGWTFPIDRAEAVVELPAGAKVLKYDAYTGPYGAKGKDFRVSYDRTGNIVFTTTRDLGRFQGLTIAVAWPKGFVTPPSLAQKAAFFLRDNLAAGAGLLWLLIVLGYYLVVWRQVGRDPEAGTIIPLFEPPKGFTPEACRELMRMGYDDKTFAAGVVNMAVKGHLTIEENDGEYTLIKKSDNRQALSVAESMAAYQLFQGGDRLVMKDTNHSLIKGARDALKKSLERELTKIYFNTNSNYLWPGAILSLLALGSVVLLSPNSGESLFNVFPLAFAAFAVYWFASKTWQEWRRGRVLMALAGLAFFFFLMVGLTGRVNWMSYFIGMLGASGTLALTGIGVLNGLFFYLLKAPTLQGRKVMDQVEGFKMYLSVAEQERLNLLNPPEKTPELFEKYLPYALALDVENEWGEQFAEVLAQAQVDGRPYSPGWYHGGSWDGFSPSRFSSSLGGAFAGAIASSSSPPGSDSAFGGGGGFSGGGGGGGGGSGW